MLLRAGRRALSPVRQRGFPAGAGDFVFLPCGRPRRVWAPGLPARLLLIAVPASSGLLRQIDAAVSDDERYRIGERYGIRVVPG